MDPIKKIDDDFNTIKHYFNLFKKGVNEMATVAEALQQFADAMDSGLNELATDIQALKDLIAEGGTVEQVNEKLQPILDKINALKNAQ